MIDNVILLLIGTRNKREMSELLPKCHPLGLFDEIGVVTVATSPAELYSCVLKDTPLGPFMAKCLKAPDLDELNIEIIRNTLFKECVVLAFPLLCLLRTPTRTARNARALTHTCTHGSILVHCLGRCFPKVPRVVLRVLPGHRWRHCRHDGQDPPV